MNKYELTVTVVWELEVEADTFEEAEALGFTYQDNPNLANVTRIDVLELTDPASLR